MNVGGDCEWFGQSVRRRKKIYGQNSKGLVAFNYHINNNVCTYAK